jgi:hypothetical protein
MSRFDCMRKPTEIGTENTQITRDLVTDLEHGTNKKG